MEVNIMQEYYEFIKQCKVYYLATVSGDRPELRPFGTIDLFEGNLYIQTGKRKNVSKQIHNNQKVAICAFSGEAWIRLNADAVPDERVEAKKHMLDAYPSLRAMYDENDDNTEVLRLENVEASIIPYGGKK